MIEPKIIKFIKEIPNKLFSSIWIQRNKIKEIDENNYFPKAKVGKSFIISGNNKILLNTILEMVNNAKQMICICSFIFAEETIKESLIEASKHGVHIYILTATDKFLRNLPDDDKEYDKKTYKQSVNLFKELKGKVKIRTADHFHSKFVIIDPKDDENKNGLLLTANLTTKALTENPEIGIILSEKEIDDIYIQFCNGFWLESDFDYIDDEFRPKLEFEDYIEIPVENVLITNSSKKSIHNNLKEIIKMANKRIVISTFGILDDNDIFNCLVDQLKNGLKVIILTRPRTKIMPSLIELYKRGARIYGHPLIHAKVCLAEKENIIQGIIMTANIEKLGLNEGFETGLLIEDHRIEDLKKIMNTWISYFPYELKSNFHLYDLDGHVINWNPEKYLLEEFYVFESKEIPLKDKITDSFEEFNNFEISEKNIQIQENKQEIYQKYIFTQKIFPPKRPRNSELISFDVFDKDTKKLLRNYAFKVYQKGNHKYLEISQMKELKEAERIAKKINAKIVSN